jgi:lipid-A-disaccharide synthase
VVHLVAPQVWAWASWRVRRLRLWSDLVLCLLPFEPHWFQEHGVRAQFVGHPVFETPLDVAELQRQASAFADGQPRVALLPGSRPSELKANWPVLLDAFGGFAERYPEAHAVVGAVDREAVGHLKRAAGELPPNLTIAQGQTDAVIRWSQLVLTVSGTVTLHIARHGRPMTILYKVNPWTWKLIGRFLLETRTFTLPNLIELGSPQKTPDNHVVREFIPFFGPTAPIVNELEALANDPVKRQQQLEVQARIVEKFDGHHAGREAAQAIADAYHQAIEAR